MPWNSKKHPLGKTEFIAPMDTFAYAKEHIHASSLWNIISKHSI